VADTAQLPPPEAKEDDELKGSEAPLLDHLIELRKRLIYSLIAVVVFFLACFAFAKQIYDLLLLPFRWAGGSNMIFTAPQELFFTYMNVALFGAIFLAFPIIAGQIYAFVAPGLYKREKRFAIPLVVSSIVLFYAGVAFAYFVVFPLMFAFLTTTAPTGVQVMTDITNYLDFVLLLFFAFGVAFEMPVATVLLAATGMVKIETMTKNRGYVILGIFVIAAILTPPDALSQTAMALPMWLLYEVGIVMSRILLREKLAQQRREEQSASS